MLGGGQNRIDPKKINKAKRNNRNNQGEGIMVAYHQKRTPEGQHLQLRCRPRHPPPALRIRSHLGL